MHFLKIFSVLSILLCCFALGMFVAIMRIPWVDFSVLEHYQPGKPSLLLDDEGKEWARFQLERHQPISLNAMPLHLIHAFIAAEDHYFFSHKGISLRGILRSFMVNLRHHRIVQGASTITQQLIKLLYFDGKRTFKRKIKEQFLALIVEQQFTKEHILETYLNHVYFGLGMYGVEAASQRLWSKSVQHLTLEESATLAAIVRSPATYSPLRNPTQAIKRRNLILQTLTRLAFITQAECLQAQSTPLIIHHDIQTSLAPHLRETIRNQLEDLVGRHLLYTGGLTIQTTLNRSTQQAAHATFTEYIQKLRKKCAIPIDGALVSIENSSGGIKALIGGFDFHESQFNRALQARRQLGSLFKPLLFAAAVDRGIIFSDTEIDEPLEFENEQHQWWQPQNFNKKFEGMMTLAHALSHSNNMIAIKMLKKIGFDQVINLARISGITQSAQPYLSLALGCVDTSLLQAASMFSLFAHKGVIAKPHMMLWIKDEWGNKIWKYQPQKTPVLSWSTTSQVTRALSLFMKRMKERFPHPWPATETIGKTGTTNDARTCWFAGATPELTTAVYLGRDDNQTLGDNVYASQTAFPLWLSFHKQLPISSSHFSYDPSLQEVTIDQRSGKSSSPSQPNSVSILVPRKK
jgi:penicillin-binding protein 1A